MSSNFSPRNRFGISVLLLTLMSIAPGCMAADATGEDYDDDEVELLGTAQQPILYGNHDYFFELSPMTWEQAQANCNANGYNLVSIDCLDEENWLRQQEAVMGGGWWWIGYNDRGFEGVWVWTDGSPIGYTNWHYGEPNNAYGNEDCAADNWPDTNAPWNDFPCTTLIKSICERRIN